MATTRDAPFVNVYAADADTIVQIRQFVRTAPCTASTAAEDGIVMTMLQFRSLMFHLKALDVSFTDNGHEEATKDNDIASCDEPTVKVAMTQTENAVANSGNDEDETRVSSATSTSTRKRHWQDANVQTSGEPVDTFDNATQLKQQHYVPAFSVPPTAINATVSTAYHEESAATPQGNVRDELAIVYAEEVLARLPTHVFERCTGCLLGMDASVFRQAHDVCKVMTRKQRIDNYIVEIVSAVDETLIREKLAARMKNSSLSFDMTKMYVEKSVLLASVKWMNKVKKYASTM